MPETNPGGSQQEGLHGASAKGDHLPYTSAEQRPQLSARALISLGISVSIVPGMVAAILLMGDSIGVFIALFVCVVGSLISLFLGVAALAEVRNSHGHSGGEGIATAAILIAAILLVLLCMVGTAITTTGPIWG
jgi:hypothetical protein